MCVMCVCGLCCCVNGVSLCLFGGCVWGLYVRLNCVCWWCCDCVVYVFYVV